MTQRRKGNSTAAAQDDARYLSVLVNAIKVCARYKPRLGQGSASGLSLDEFQALYGADPFYSWLGLDNRSMYAAHKAAGGMTSIYRQIGTGVERILNQIIRDQFALTTEQASWSYEVLTPAGKSRTLKLDARIAFDDVLDRSKRARVEQWVSAAAADLGVSNEIRNTLKGAVFEVRQGYKSKDSKRQNGDIANASTAYTQAYLPCCVVFSTQIDNDIVVRYRNEKWAILTGATRGTVLKSTYVFAKDVLGYDLAGFFVRNSGTLRTEIQRVLDALLSPN